MAADSGHYEDQGGQTGPGAGGYGPSGDFVLGSELFKCDF